jgi:hypothetical protein
MGECPPYFTGITLLGGNFSCTPKCPIPYYSDEEYTSLATVANIIGVLAMFSSFITLIPHFALPSRRAWPHVLLPTLFSCIFVLGFHYIFLIIAYRHNWRDLVCDERSQMYHTGTSNNWCTFDAIVTFICAIMAILQWGAIDIYLTLRIFRINIGTYSNSNSTRESYLSTKAQIILVYGIIITYTVISSVIIVIKDQIQGTGEGGHCFIKPGKYYTGFWIIPLIIIELLGLINTFIILGYSCLLSSNTKMALSFIKSQWRILVFRTIFLIAAGSVTIYWLVWNPRTDKIEKSVEAWLQCSAATFEINMESGSSLVVARNIAISTCKSLPKVPPYRTTVWAIMVVPLAAFTFPLLFLFQRDILAWLLNVLSGNKKLGQRIFGIDTERSGNGGSPKTTNTRDSIETWNTDTNF